MKLKKKIFNNDELSTASNKTFKTTYLHLKLYYLLLFGNALYAQQNIIKVKLLNTDRIPISSATITLYPSERNFVTSEKGLVEIDKLDDEILIISHLSYQTKKTKILQNKNDYTLYLKENINVLEEVFLTKTLSGSLTLDVLKNKKRDTLQLGALQQYIDKPTPKPKLETYGWSFDPVTRILFRKKYNYFLKVDRLKKTTNIEVLLTKRNDFELLNSYAEKNNLSIYGISKTLFECGISIPEIEKCLTENLIYIVENCKK